MDKKFKINLGKGEKIMPVVQEVFNVPEDIAAKILTGEYRRIGGVVRHAVGPNKGQIVQHLKSVDLKANDQVESMGVKAIQFAKNNKKALVVVGVGTGIVAVGAGLYHKMKNTEPKVVTEFRAALKEYINAIRVASLNEEVINKMMDALDKLKKHKNYEKIQIQLSAEELNTLVNRIFEYTQRLAKDNKIELSDIDNAAPDIMEDSIVTFQRYLAIQKHIFEEAA